jgi:hypothetical protein
LVAKVRAIEAKRDAGIVVMRSPSVRGPGRLHLRDADAFAAMGVKTGVREDGVPAPPAAHTAPAEPAFLSQWRRS